MAKVSKKIDLKKRLNKAQKKGLHTFEVDVEGKNAFKFGIESLREDDDPSKNFSGAAHLTQLLTLLPNVNATSEESPNLVAGKGITAYCKVTELFVNEENSKPQAKFIVKTVPRIRQNELLTQADSADDRWEASSVEEKKTKKKHSSKK